MKISFANGLGVAIFAPLAALLFTPTAQAADSYWTYPVIAKYGPTHPVPKAHVRPKKNHMYKAIFDVTASSDDPSKPDAGLAHVARAVNVFAMAGVPPENLKFVAVLHGGATTAILNNATYKAKYGVDNPNIPLIDALHKAGVHVDVCAQALAEMQIVHAKVYKRVRIDLSALSDAVIYGDMGYAYMKE
jgi:intracellular sulfur oxidation DsrE/DsrF family protein